MTPPVQSALFENQTKVGAKVISFSFGGQGTMNYVSTTSDYNDFTREIDNYLYQNPDVLALLDSPTIKTTIVNFGSREIERVCINISGIYIL